MNIEKNLITKSNTITAEEFCKLREMVNFQSLSMEQAQRVLAHTTYLVALFYDNVCIGITRLLFDYGTDAYITDVIVHPHYQGNGIGRILLEDILSFIKENSMGTKVACSLYANIGKEEFYNKFGFSKLPNNKYGYGMILEL